MVAVPPAAVWVTRNGPELWDVPAAMVTGAPVTANWAPSDTTWTVTALVALTGFPEASRSWTEMSTHWFLLRVMGPAQGTVIPSLRTQLTNPRLLGAGAVVVVVVVELVVVEELVEVLVEVEVEVDEVAVDEVVVPPDKVSMVAETV
jgi:hypothetical protein